MKAHKKRGVRVRLNAYLSVLETCTQPGVVGVMTGGLEFKHTARRKNLKDRTKIVPLILK